MQGEVVGQKSPKRSERWVGSRSPLLSGKGRSTPGAGAETINVLGIVKSSKKRLTKACPLGEAQVVEVRRVDRFEIDRVLHERLGEDLKEDPAQLEAVGAEERFVAEDDVKTSGKDTQK